MRITPGAPLPPNAPIRVVAGEYEGYEGFISGHTEVNGKLTTYRVTIRRPDEDEGMEFITDVPADAVSLVRLDPRRRTI